MTGPKLEGRKMKFRKIARSLIERQGYAIYKEELSSYGITPFVDIRRLMAVGRATRSAIPSQVLSQATCMLNNIRQTWHNPPDQGKYSADFAL
jgi:hypothetical protein